MGVDQKYVSKIGVEIVVTNRADSVSAYLMKRCLIKAEISILSWIVEGCKCGDFGAIYIDTDAIICCALRAIKSNNEVKPRGGVSKYLSCFAPNC